MPNPFTGYPLLQDKTNATAAPTTHPAHHNTLARCINEVQDTVTTLSKMTSAYAEVAADQGTFTAETDLTSLAVTVTVPAGRRIQVTGSVRLRSSTLDDEVELRVKESTTVLESRAMTPGPANRDAPLRVSAVILPSAGSHTYKLAALRSAGAGNVTMKAAGGAKAWILVEDVT